MKKSQLPKQIHHSKSKKLKKFEQNFFRLKENEKEKLLNIIKTKENIILLLEKKMEDIEKEQKVNEIKINFNIYRNTT